MGLRDVMLEIGPVKITVSDLWTVLDPSEVTAAEAARIQTGVAQFLPGWLTDAVNDIFQPMHPIIILYMMICLFIFRLQDLFPIIPYFSQFFSRIGYRRIYNTVLAGQCYLSEIVRRGSSTRRTWADVNFSRIELILLPSNFSGNHWTLFVSVKSNLSRCFHLIGLCLQ